MFDRQNEKMKKYVSDSSTIKTELVMPNDTNPIGNLMGGNLMRWMDVVASICAGKHCEAYVVTASVDHVSFQKPITLGCVVTLEAKVTRAFNTSLEVFVEVFTRDMKGKQRQKSNHAYFTFVALDDETKKPIPIPKLEPISEEEIRLYEGASRRRELRLILGGRLKPSDAVEMKSFFLNNEK